MNRRLRKKHRLGEFQELGFSLSFALPSQWSEREQLTFWDRAIERIESLGLAVGGGAGLSWDVFVAGLAHRSSVTPAQRQALLDWLSADQSVSALHAGPLVDAWHGAFEPAPAAS